ncbi:putative hydroxypyruvate reductase [Magnetospirillum sp. LM-5]|uniref:glycerate kinase type-2 family protein n=1 Tax=Magnetospirillum sp. LM-5 TaxID=2681466 RepID=UPI0013806F3D|nr:glycerate kinase [Magnetospirillum sp. LM-5]CAA7611460.1 putative hydroxypyruvate reductase [Magnetospirillum sp. LM-5]
MSPAALLREMFAQAVAAALPARSLAAFLPAPPKGRTIVIGAGKAAASMAHVVEAHWPGPLTGLVVTRTGHGAACSRIRVVEAGHPLPDADGLAAAALIFDMVGGLTADDLVLFLASGGGSALLALPAPGIDLADKRAVGAALLRSGAPIADINCVRKHLSSIKGGRLAAAAFPARFVTLAISDVPGDDPSTIASGPGIADPTSFADARAVVERWKIAVPDAVRRHLANAHDETPKPGDPRLARAETFIVATALESLLAAARLAESRGFRTLVLGDSIEGEAREVAKVMAGIALSARRNGQPLAAPLAILSGGETTVSVRGTGRGGRNAEFLLALALALDGAPDIHAIACDTDGIDGSEDNAGAILAPDSLSRARTLGVDPAARLEDNDAYGFFAALNDLVVTGPTRTNVNDFRAILIR